MMEEIRHSTATDRVARVRQLAVDAANRLMMAADAFEERCLRNAAEAVAMLERERDARPLDPGEMGHTGETAVDEE